MPTETRNNEIIPNIDLRDKRDARRKSDFLKNLAMTSHVTGSAKAAGVAKSTIYKWRNDDPAFCAAWMQALAAGFALLELELLHRAREGTEKAVFYGGKKVATVREYNDGMAFRLLMAHKEMVAMTRAAQADIAEQKGTSAIRAELDQKLALMRQRLLARRKADAKPTAAAPNAGGASPGKNV